MAIFTLDLLAATPNLNGNTESSLLAQLRTLLTDLKHVREAMSLCSDHWHGRNFIPQGSEEARIVRMVAENAWRLRMDAVDTMHEEFLALALEIQAKGRPPAEIVPAGWESVEGGVVMEMPSTDEAIEAVEHALFDGDEEGDSNAKP